MILFEDKNCHGHHPHASFSGQLLLLPLVHNLEAHKVNGYALETRSLWFESRGRQPGGTACSKEDAKTLRVTSSKFGLRDQVEIANSSSRVPHERNIHARLKISVAEGSLGEYSFVANNRYDSRPPLCHVAYELYRTAVHRKNANRIRYRIRLHVGPHNPCKMRYRTSFIDKYIIARVTFIVTKTISCSRCPFFLYRYLLFPSLPAPYNNNDTTSGDASAVVPSILKMPARRSQKTPEEAGRCTAQHSAALTMTT